MNKSQSQIALLTLIFLSLFLFSCKTLPKEQKEPIRLSRELLGKGQLSATQLADFFCFNNPEADYEYILNFANIYIEEGNAEGINSDAAFAQMCHETGFLRFGGLVQPEMHNYCGLGAMDADHPGEIFPDERTGIRAHIQHLQAYATTADTPLNQDLVDPRYSWVHKTKFIQTIDQLAGTWATDPLYGEKLEGLLQRMENFTSEE